MGLKIRVDNIICGGSTAHDLVTVGNELLLKAGLGPTNVAVTCEEHGQQPRHILLRKGVHIPVCVKCVMTYIAPELAEYKGPGGH